MLQSTFFQSVSQKPSFLETDHFFQSKDIPGISQYKYYKSIPLRMVKSTTGTAPPTKPPGSGPGGVVAPPRAPRPGSGRPPLGRGVARASDAESGVGWAWAWNCWVRERSEDNLWKEPKAEKKKENVEPVWGESGENVWTCEMFSMLSKRSTMHNDCYIVISCIFLCWTFCKLQWGELMSWYLDFASEQKEWPTDGKLLTATMPTLYAEKSERHIPEIYVW